MRVYLYPHYFFKKKWIWFAPPKDVNGVDSVTYFSYEDVETPKGFKKKEGSTSVINLSRQKDEIWESFRKKYIRKQIERGYGNGITAHTSEDFDTFFKIYKDFRRAKKLIVEPKKLFQKNGILFLAHQISTPVAAGVFLSDGEYMRALTLVSKRMNTDMRESVGQANRILIWEAIQYAQKTGHTYFDLGGLPTSEKDTHLRTFKEGFGGEEWKQFYYSKQYSNIIKFIQKIKKYI